MPINIIIQEKRKEIGLTQEQIGAYLGVSTPAVNKWEKGYTYPDISLLPALARLLKIDLNTLLCFNEGLTEQEIDHFNNEVGATISTKGFEAGFIMSMEKIREYPNCDKLIHSIALLLDGALIMYGASIDDKEPYEKQITALYERVAKSDNDQVRDNAIYMLASKYLARTECEKAQEMLELLPERTALDKTELEARLFIKQDKLDEAARLLERKLLNVVSEVQMILMNLAEIEIKEGESQKASHLAELSQKVMKLFELGDMQALAIPLHVAILQKNVEDSISFLKSYFLATFTPWDISKSSLCQHIAVKVKTSKAVKEEVVKEKQENLGKQVRLALLSEFENNPKYMFLHSNAEFKQLIEDLYSKC
ncbi:helix-turn-helix domain-containing protein [Clostridium cibarium]|uniref:Helix-turn-helix transcriptional regulator n=1 Tax=Clostridium cibarium TaxID=2762247 RepID=A0ABR8PYW9_9CLOT|nr:helix-turn-helix transcriptional regulator [Clostridium cibarium]MBD7913376.1 helix-turn-helix transcriptional regulator [Clostridium cibarium]